MKTDNCVLKLSAAYMPLDIISWQEAVCLWYKGVAEIVDSYEDRVLHSGYDKYLGTWKDAMQCPAVIRLRTFVNPKKKIQFYKPFTRKNVYDRDNHKCQYCSDRVSMAQMTFDHVKPRSKGGLTSWNNIVCSCYKCNSKKSNRTPEEAGMKLRKKPFAPLLADNFNDGIMDRMKGMKRVLNNEKWKQWIYWNVEMESD